VKTALRDKMFQDVDSKENVRTESKAVFWRHLLTVLKIILNGSTHVSK
jgi:hypothetical protein